MILSTSVEIFSPVLLYNTKAFSRVAWMGEMEGLLSHFYDDTPRMISGQWRVAMETFPGVKLVKEATVPGYSGLKVENCDL